MLLFIDGVGVELPHHTTLKILPASVCEERYDMLEEGHPVKAAVSIEESVLCAIADVNGKDSCHVNYLCFTHIVLKHPL